VSDVSQLFAAQIEVLVNKSTQLAVLRANAYTVPDHIEDQVATISDSMVCRCHHAGASPAQLVMPL
jgi:hypothetical protein